MIRFIYSGDIYNRDRELVIENLTTIVSSLIELPEQIEIEFKNLGKSLYGETLIENRFRNRIRLHDELSPKNVIKPLIHELLHLNQTHTGKLACRSDGTYVWKGNFFRVDTRNITVEDWAKLPWEIDVANNQDTILAKVLSI